MERVISENEKIRRAEEIYSRRKEQVVRVPTSRVNTSKNNKKNFDRVQKMVLQICICILIYTSLYVVQNSNYIFSENVINRTREVLYYDINFPERFNQFIDYMKNSAFFGSGEEESGGAVVGDGEEGNTIEGDQTESEPVENDIDENAAIGGSSDSDPILGESKIVEYITDESSYNQMRVDAEEIKKKWTLQLPVKSSVYSISSKFGIRTIDPTFHSGIDLAAKTGTEIYAAIDGTVTLASSEGDYGRHLKIEDGDLATLYAHCNKLLVKQGDKVKKGQKIAEMGNTGNSSGPHLHFEIFYRGRLVNPEYVVKF